MSKFEEFLSQQNPQEKPVISEGIAVEGAFTCQFCDEIVEEAEHFPAKRILKWDCQSCGRTSLVENF